MQPLRAIIRWMAAALAGVGLAVALVLLLGYLALLAWDHAHPPVLPGLEQGRGLAGPVLPARHGK